MTGTERPVRPRRPRPDQPLRARWDPTADDARLSGAHTDDSGEATGDAGTKRGSLRGFISDYGWRAYAIPVLVVLTVALIVVTVRDKDSGDTQPASVGDVRNTDISRETKAIGAPDAAVSEAAVPLGALPDGGPFTTKGDREYRTIAGTTGRVGTGKQEYTYTIEVEKGLRAGDYGGDSIYARMVDNTLANKQSWIGGNEVSFRRITSGEPALRITLASTDTTRELCGYQIKLESSCFYPPEGRVVLNEARWIRGAIPFQGDGLLYRQYLVNHEVGHGIGYEHHVPCAENDGLAPIMMQQTFGTSNADILALDPGMKANRSFVCRPNAWPFPDKK